MHGAGHRWVGAGFGLAALGPATWSHPLLAVAAVSLGALGGTAPDWLEVPYWGNRRLITHRTFTHWVPLWLLALWAAHVHARDLGSWPQMIFPFLLGGLSHLLMDWPNPAGVPFLWPTWRHSLNWWNSGRYDTLLVALVWTGVALSLLR
jgi:membrane-bound metal-dependent hydrolase YbcI (DUF457 family)